MRNKQLKSFSDIEKVSRKVDSAMAMRFLKDYFVIPKEKVKVWEDRYFYVSSCGNEFDTHKKCGVTMSMHLNGKKGKLLFIEEGD